MIPLMHLLMMYLFIEHLSLNSSRLFVLVFSDRMIKTFKRVKNLAENIHFYSCNCQYVNSVTGIKNYNKTIYSGHTGINIKNN